MFPLDSSAIIGISNDFSKGAVQRSTQQSCRVHQSSYASITRRGQPY